MFTTLHRDCQNNTITMSYQMYRSSTLGCALEQVLHEFVEEGQITTQLEQRVMAVFDKCINHALSTRLKNKTTFKVRFFVWLRLSEFRPRNCAPTASAITSGPF